MLRIKTKEASSLWIALLAAAIVGIVLGAVHVRWGYALVAVSASFCVVFFAALFIIRKYVAYKLKPIYSIVLSRDVHTNEIFSELKDKRVENIGEELTAWADTNDREIARLKEAERFRKQYLGNVAHELKTPIFNIQGYISTLLDGGLEDELIKLWKKTGTTVLFITHNIEEAVYLSQKIMVLTNKPTSVKTVLDNPLPLPRDVVSPEFVELRNKVTDLIKWW